MKQSDLDVEIRDLIESEIQIRSFVPKPWIVQTIVAKHNHVSGDDRHFALLCMQGHVHGCVGKVLRSMRPTPKEQLALPILQGYKRIVTRYSITRNGDEGIVATVDMTEAEALEKALEYEAIGQGCLEHAAELRRFAAERAAEAAA